MERCSRGDVGEVYWVLREAGEGKRSWAVDAAKKMGG